MGVDLLAILQKASFNNLQNNDIGLISNNNLYKEISRYCDFYVTGISGLENKHSYANPYGEKFISKNTLR
ncbi:MAG: hypothetical protein ACJAR3_001748 [Roseivirga sp.]|jgi:hypothetical protein